MAPFQYTMMHRPFTHCCPGAADTQLRPTLLLSGARLRPTSVKRGLSVSHVYQRKNDYLSFDWDGAGDDLDDSKNRYDDFIRSDAPAYTTTRPRRNGNNLSPDAWNRFDIDDYDEYEDDMEYLSTPQPPARLSDEVRYLNGKPIPTNYEITQPLLRLIGENKEPLGMKTRDIALQTALDAGMDLILINPQEAPPVARLMEWSRFKFEIEQGEKSKKAKAVIVETKEVRISPKTDDHDISTKIKSAQKFLGKGNKVKLVMKFEGRQLQHKDHGKEVLMKFITELGETAKVEGPLSFKGAMYQVILIPGKMAPSSPSSSSAPSSSSSNSSSPTSSRQDAAPASAGVASSATAPVPPAQAPAPPPAPGPPAQMPLIRPTASPPLSRPMSPVPPGNRPLPLRPLPVPGSPMPPNGPPMRTPPSPVSVPRPFSNLQPASGRD